MEIRPIGAPADQKPIWRWLCCGAMAVLAALLLLFWEPLRSLNFVQNLSALGDMAVLNLFFGIFDFLGDEQFFMIFISLIVWCYHKSLGYWASVLLLLTASSGDSLKVLTAHPRPELDGVRQASDFSLPNGPTSLSMAVWGYLSFSLKSKVLGIWSAIAIVLVAFTELVLWKGFLGDILGGLLLGLLTLAIYVLVSSTFITRGWNEKFSFPLLLILAVAIPVALIFVWTWDGAPKLMGYLAGGSFGFVLERQKLRFQTKGKWYQQLAKALIGLAGLFGIVLGLNGFFAGDVPVTMFAHFALIGLWVTLIAPSIFVLLRLTSREQA